MSSGINKAKEQVDLMIANNQQTIITNIATRIALINPGTQDYHDLVFLSENKEKILRNKKLIELLG